MVLLAQTKRALGLLLLLISLGSAASNTVIVKDASPLPANAHPVPASEHIIDFTSRAHFNPDGSMEMRETIKVLSQGNEIRRGIFRTLPLTWNRQDGKIFRVNYAIESVTRDGLAEPYSLDEATKTLTVRIGSARHILQPGIYNYEIRYKVSNHFSRFSEWDELYWNVTGNDWSWPISKANFHLELPQADSHLNAEGKDNRLRTIDAYTGSYGEKAHNATILPDGSIQTSRPLATGEGLTVVYTWPRTILADAPAPEAALPLVHLLVPTRETSLIWLPLVLLMGYYLLWWRKNVSAAKLKMPSVVPQFSVPETMSPGYLRFITQRKYDDEAFSSDLLGLVAKGALTLTTKKNKTRSSWFSPSHDEQLLSRPPSDNKLQLNASNKKLLKMLFSNKRKEINLNIPHQPEMQTARKWLENCCEEKRPQLLLKGSTPLRHCIYIALLVPVVCGVWFNAEAALLTIPGLLFPLFGLTVLAFLLKFLRHPLKTGRAWGATPFFIALIIGPFAINFGVFFLIDILPTIPLPPGYIGALLSAIILCAFVGCTTPRYTQDGLKDLAIAKGLKMYITTAEKQRFQALYPPEQMIAHFESLLPVALALGVGKTWANSFAKYLRETGAMSEIFEQADWRSVNKFSNSCQSASNRASSRDGGGSSSGSGYSGSGSSGRGSSGGGSGGGGGGGW